MCLLPSPALSLSSLPSLSHSLPPSPLSVLSLPLSLPLPLSLSPLSNSPCLPQAPAERGVGAQKGGRERREGYRRSGACTPPGEHRKQLSPSLPLRQRLSGSMGAAASQSPPGGDPDVRPRMVFHGRLHLVIHLLKALPFHDGCRERQRAGGYITLHSFYDSCADLIVATPVSQLLLLIISSFIFPGWSVEKEFLFRSDGLGIRADRIQT